MDKQEKKGMSSHREILLAKATKQDWAYVRLKTGLSRTLISYYRTGSKLNNAKIIEMALAKSIAMREHAERKHQRKIEQLLSRKAPIEGLQKGIKEHLEKKYSHE